MFVGCFFVVVFSFLFFSLFLHNFARRVSATISDVEVIFAEQQGRLVHEETTVWWT